jgi:hypothetical protein
MTGSGDADRGHPSGVPALVEGAGVERPLTVDTFAGTAHVRWAPDEAVTPLGQLPFFIDYLKQAGLFDPLVADSPLHYTSPNAPSKRDVLGALVLSILTGAKRYAHVSALRHDGVNPALLGMTKVCGDDSVRRALAALVDPDTPREAITSRPMLMDGVVRATRHAGRTTLSVTTLQGKGVRIRAGFEAVAAFLSRLRATAPQLTATERWCANLARALAPYLNGRTPRPPLGLLPA